ncbi:hypothetical protein K6U49_09515 [Vibrio alginolyticus]|uniref:hypothetical protein n=1 Tax=Vibrio alginolyticus TaxID=663 RepID=UPI001EEA0A81|nr:hypothetical protein [Vibrio alginolyticus]MCG6308821.1 hypothetical protein [Vibrio alginolyticus]
MLGIVIGWLLFLLLLTYNKILSTKLFVGDYFLLFVPLLYGLISLMLTPYNYHYLQMNSYLVAVIYISIVYIFVVLLKDFEYEFIVKIFKYVLVLLSFIILLQWAIYLSFGEYLDFNKLVSFGKSESRYTSNTFRILGLIRPTAFFTEPSNASAVISMFTFCYMFLVKKLDGYVILGFLTSILTLSTAGVLIGSISLGFLLLFYKSGNRSKLFKVLISCLSMIIIFYMLSFSYDRVNSASEYDMIASRSVIANLIFDQAWYNHLLGNGITILSEPIFIGNNLVHDYSFRDSGFFVNLYYSFGLIGFILFLFWSRLNIKNNIHLVIFFVVLQSKFDYLQPVFWLLIFTVSMLDYDNKEKKEFFHEYNKKFINR